MALGMKWELGSQEYHQLIMLGSYNLHTHFEFLLETINALLQIKDVKRRSLANIISSKRIPRELI